MYSFIYNIVVGIILNDHADALQMQVMHHDEIHVHVPLKELLCSSYVRVEAQDYLLPITTLLGTGNKQGLSDLSQQCNKDYTILDPVMLTLKFFESISESMYNPFRKPDFFITCKRKLFLKIIY